MSLSTPLLTITIVGAASLLVSLLVARWLATSDRAGTPLDYPNARSLHATPVPRHGGLALIGSLAVAGPAALILGDWAPEPVWIALALSLVASLAYLDDLGHVARRWRLLSQLAATGLLGGAGLLWSQLELPGLAPIVFPWPLALLLTTLFVVWMINLYNFMDGMDGFAAGMAVFGFTTLAILGWRADEHLYTLIVGATALAAAGFLTVNFPPARIFLGDVGSSTLGLLAAALSLWGTKIGVFPLWMALLAFSPFIVDATWTLLVRLARGERIWEPHRSHHYQRLVLAGWTHRKTTLYAYLIMAAVGACAIAAPQLTPREQWFLLGGWAIIYILIHVKVRLLERMAQARRTLEAG